jgi:hypothetical protein
VNTCGGNLKTSVCSHALSTLHVPPSTPATHQEFRDRKRARERVENENACDSVWVVGEDTRTEGGLAARLTGEGKFIFVLWLTQV